MHLGASATWRILSSVGGQSNSWRPGPRHTVSRIPARPLRELGADRAADLELSWRPAPHTRQHASSSSLAKRDQGADASTV